jgi:hypothetical protein
MLASRALPTVLPKSEYITCSSRAQAVAGTGVLQPYVTDIKPDFFGIASKLAKQ